MGYAILQIGRSFESDIPENPERDMGSATRAIEAFEEYLKRFPKTDDAKTARGSIQKIRNTLASKEWAVAQFYTQNKQLDSAQARMKKILRLYPESEVATLAREKLKVLESEAPPSGSQKP